MQDELRNELGCLGRDIGVASRVAVNGLPFALRGVRVGAILKKTCPRVDAVGEEITINYLHKFAHDNGLKFGMIVSGPRGEVHYIGNGSKLIYTIPDPVDGTIKAAGLGSDLDSGIYRLGNDGVWGASIAFTDVTDKMVGDLRISDFKSASIVDGNPRTYSVSPDHAYTHFENGVVRAVELLERDVDSKRKGDLVTIVTSSQKTLRQGVIALDKFQAFSTSAEMGMTLDSSQQTEFDRQQKDYLTRVLRIGSKLENRNEGGAFDIWRAYGSAAEILCTMFGRKGIVEPQGVARIALRDELGNVVPGYVLTKAAGGEVIDLTTGKDIGELSLSDPRPELMAVANPTIKEAILKRLTI